MNGRGRYLDGVLIVSGLYMYIFVFSIGLLVVRGDCSFLFCYRCLCVKIE